MVHWFAKQLENFPQFFKNQMWSSYPPPSVIGLLLCFKIFSGGAKHFQVGHVHPCIPQLATLVNFVTKLSVTYDQARSQVEPGAQFFWNSKTRKEAHLTIFFNHIKKYFLPWPAVSRLWEFTLAMGLYTTKFSFLITKNVNWALLKMRYKIFTWLGTSFYKYVWL